MCTVLPLRHFGVYIKREIHGNRGIHFSVSTCTVLRISPGQGQNNQSFGGSLVSVKSIEKVSSMRQQVQRYSDCWKEAFSL